MFWKMKSGFCDIIGLFRHGKGALLQSYMSVIIFYFIYVTAHNLFPSYRYFDILYHIFPKKSTHRTKTKIPSLGNIKPASQFVYNLYQLYR